MSLYADSAHDVRGPLVDAHQRTLDSFSAPGSWFNAEQRSALVAETRDARIGAGLQPPNDTDDAAFDTGRSVDVSDTARRVARDVAVSTNDMDSGYYEQALTDGLSDAEYTEVVGIAARACNLDVFARGIGIPSRQLSRAQSGEPDRQRPATAIHEGAWTPTIPGGRRGQQDAIDTYGTDRVEGAPFIYRALSLVPDEARGLIRLGAAQYVEIADFMDLEFTFEPTISRTQVELLAARVSAINECFY